MQNRIHQLYQWLKFEPPIYPWMWDYDHYTGAENEDMKGLFYPEDLAVIQIFGRWEYEKAKQEYDRQQRKANKK